MCSLQRLKIWLRFMVSNCGRYSAEQIDKGEIGELSDG